VHGDADQDERCERGDLAAQQRFWSDFMHCA
jgi:hypothetical protein